MFCIEAAPSVLLSSMGCSSPTQGIAADFALDGSTAVINEIHFSTTTVESLIPSRLVNLAVVHVLLFSGSSPLE